MELLEFALIGIALGLSLGLFGGGGGILAIPLLVAAGVPTDEAGTTSLVVVGIGAMGGLIPHARAGRIAWREGVVFSALGAAGAIAGSRLALVTDDRIQLWGFAVVLVVAGTLMLRKSLRSGDGGQSTPRARQAWWLVVVAALVVGLFTGFFGVGGGFLVVPALALVMGMSMYRATATALLVITLNSAVAFIPRAGEALDLTATVVVAAFVLISSALAARWSNRWSERGLGIGFASLVLAMSVLTLAQASAA
ncbi:MAG: sulfite exporter TauE/SafE family protein [Actinobacteria bacterium]|nr:sulfite exporter TauE/SafE family protein [Actinomycetota bacterium]MCB8996683.1 sulfite exporter TauE/SafE family protein [Actinomycetota bacterium]MCB9415655.1 sulfite exporter TauE/SafE family protein [Actinomycetota bacterium]